MNGERCNVSNYWHSILEVKGGSAAIEAKKALLDDPSLIALREPLEFISENWADPLRPALMSFACEAVGGSPDKTKNTAVAIALMNLSFYLWDDVIDETKSRLFKPTVVGKYDADTALIIGGLASAKAFMLLSQDQFNEDMRSCVYGEIWNLWTSMASAEIKNLHARKTLYHSSDKFSKIEKECETNLATCLRIGAILGKASKTEIDHLGNYGKYLGIIIDLRNDLRVAMNLTLELSQKIESGALPFSLLWAREHSGETADLLLKVSKKKQLDSEDVRAIVSSVMKANVVRKIQVLTKNWIKRAVAELAELRQNDATQSLRSFVEAQLQMLLEGLTF